MRHVALWTLPLFLLGCPTFSPIPIPCQTAANCPTSYQCSASGVCVQGDAGSAVVPDAGPAIVPAVRVAISPAIATVPVGQTQRFAAFFNGDAGAASWSVTGAGTIAQDGSYTAPASVPDGGADTIVATSLSDPHATGQAMALVVAVNPVPTLTSADPSQVGEGSPDLSVTLTGTGFISTSALTFDQVSLTPQAISATTIQATVPKAELAVAGSHSFAITNPAPGGGASGPLTFTVTVQAQPVPTISSVTPPSAPVGSPSTTLVIAGTGFTAESVASLDGADLSLTGQTATALTAQVSGASLVTARAATLTVTNPRPDGGSASVSFPVDNLAPALTSASPMSAPAGGSEVTVTLSGTSFAPSSVVVANDGGLTTLYVSATSLSATVPAALLAAPGVIALTVETPAPGGGNSAPLEFQVTNPAPVVLSLLPASLPIGSAGTLTVTGTGFVGSSVINWNGTALGTSYVSSTELSASLTAALLSTLGSVPVTVTNPPPGGGTSAPQTFDVDAPVPAIVSLSPSSVAVGSAGFTLTVTGSGFLPSSTIDLGATPLTTTYVNATSLTAPVPTSALTSAQAAQVTVVNPGPGGGLSNSASLSIQNPSPAFGSMSPVSALSGSAAFTLTLSGTNFAINATVHFGGTSLTPSSATANQLVVTVPASLLSVSGQPLVEVVSPGPGGGTSNGLRFSVQATITTIAGGAIGDQGPALAASLEQPLHGAVNPLNGLIYYVEDSRDRVMMIDASGNVQVVAGTAGVCGTSGNGGPARAALLCSPDALAFDSAGDLYVVDQGGNELREISASGTISLIAGNNSCNNTGDGAAASLAEIGGTEQIAIAPNGNIYLSMCGCNNGHRVRMISGGIISTIAGTGTASSTGDGAAATAATLNCPYGLAVDDGGANLYIAEVSGERVREVNFASGIINRVAGTGNSGYSGDGGLATLANIGSLRDVLLDSAGDLFISSTSNGLILEVNAATQDIGVLAGTAPLSFSLLSGDNGPATSAYIGQPGGMFFDSSGVFHFFNVRTSESGLTSELRQISASGTLTTVAGVGNPSAATTPFQLALNRPTGIATDSVGNLFFGSSYDARVWKLDVAGNLSLAAGTGLFGFGGDTAAATLADLYSPAMLWYDSSGGDFYIADNQNGRVRNVNSIGDIETIAGSSGWPAGCPGGPPSSPPSGAGPGYDCYGDDYFANKAYLYSPANFTVAVASVVGDGAGNLYIAEGDRVRQVVLSTGIITTLAGSTSTTASCGFSGDTGPAAQAKLCATQGLTIDAAGDLIVADSGNHRLRQINLQTVPVGEINTIAGNGTSATSGDGIPAAASPFCSPWGLTYDAAGNLYVTDNLCHTVSLIDTSGIIHRVAGTGIQGFAGDNQAATTAELSNPTQVAVSPNGQIVYVADEGNSRIRQIGP
jgi:hypothetical protein